MRASRETDKFGFLFKLILYLQRNDMKNRVKKMLIIWKKKYPVGTSELYRAVDRKQCYFKAGLRGKVESGETIEQQVLH